MLADSPQPFTFGGLRPRVVFGWGTLDRVSDELNRLGRRRALILTGPRQRTEAEQLAARLGAAAVGVLAEAAMHTPLEVTEHALVKFRDAEADSVISLGGGSTTGLGKAIALRSGADQLVIPTTYAGSEMTDILGETAGGAKTTRRDPAILPETVVYDVSLTVGLPVKTTTTSGLNALAHAAEALYAKDGSPVISLLAAEAIEALVAALPVIVRRPRDGPARTKALYGAWLCGAALGGASMALHHKLCHVLGGSFNTPHADTHAIMLPHTIGFNAAAAGRALAPLSAALNGKPGPALFDFAAKLGAPQRLQDLGLSIADLDLVADIATRQPYPNPRPIERESIRELLQDAWEGCRPQA
jgi:maleylacetate reductase